MTVRWIEIILISVFFCTSLFSHAFDVSFTDVTAQEGLTYLGPSYGVSWGDYDRDGQPDLFLSNHALDGAIYRNTGDGFTNVAFSVVGSMDGDTHGGAWGDFDNDGDQDLAIAVGAAFGTGEEPNRVLERRENDFRESAQELGLQYGAGRGRTPLWLDWNNDRKLDLIFSNLPRQDGMAPTAMFTQTEQGFEQAAANLGFQPEGDTHYSMLMVDGPSSTPNLLVQRISGFPSGLFDYSVMPFEEQSIAVGLSGISPAIHDVLAGDFDNDLVTEIYLTRIVDPMVVRATSDQRVRAFLVGESDQSFGMSFASSGEITVSMGPIFALSLDQIRIGSLGYSPTDYSFTVDRNDSINVGEFSGDPQAQGVFIHYDDADDLWYFTLRLPTTLGVIIDSTESMQNVQPINIPNVPTTAVHEYLDKVDALYFENTVSTGLAQQKACGSGVSADFDNDMDLDIYLVCNDKAGNLPNQLLENDGNGNFSNAIDAAGAQGSMAGIGDSVAVADYDSDGFLDILVTNGAGAPPLNTDGPTQLFRNMGNANHWLELELRGTISNADGVGATVLVVAGGVTQYRLQDNGMHRYSQNHSRLHFGLGGNTMVERVEIKWPSGELQILNNVSADQILTVTEVFSGDTDGDSVTDASDNCVIIANADQRDTNGDGIGNACDPDLDNNCVVNYIDFALLANELFNPDANVDADFDGNGVVQFLDLFVLKEYFLLAPGPSGISTCD